MTPSTVEQLTISRRSVMTSAVATGAVLTSCNLGASATSAQDLKAQRPRVTAFIDGAGSVESSLQMLEAYAVDADLVIVSVPDERRYSHLIRSLGEAINVVRKRQSYVLVLSQPPALSDPFTCNRLIGPQGMITPFLDKIDIVSWQTKLGVIAATNSEQLDELRHHFSTGVRPDLIVCHGGFRDGFHEDVDRASAAYKVHLQDIDNKGPKILTPSGQILTQAAPGFMQGVTAKIDVMAVRQARARPDADL